MFPKTLSNTSEDTKVPAKRTASPKVQTIEERDPISPAKT